MEDASDILGGQLNVAQHGASQPWADITFLALLYYIVLTISLGMAVYFLQPYYAQLRDRRYRKNLRRRHGIPDHDRRPFNLAFAAAKKAHLNRDSKESTPSTVNTMASAGSQTTVLQRQISRQRLNGASSSRARQTGNEVIVIPSDGPSYVESRRTSGDTTTVGGVGHRPVKGATLQSIPEGPSAAQPLQSVHRSAMYSRDQVEAPSVRSKHGLEDGAEAEKDIKKTRVEGDELIDGNEEAEWHGSDVDMNVDADAALSAPLTRGSKRTAEGDSDEGFESSRGERRDKRARKNIKGKEATLGGHASSEARGKKRDRTEAGSGPGGDNSVLDDEDDGQHRVVRRRRVVTNGNAPKKTSSTRGRKRGRELSSPDSDGSDSPSRRAARHKRGKRGIQAGETTDEDTDTVSIDPLCYGHHIGEEWQVGNVWYKVGPSGQRLRRANVKSRQPAFHMPNDSIHPDRNINYEIYVQEWLTDEKYKLAKEQQEILEPDLSRPASLSDLKSPSDVSSPTKGKNLLYASTSAKDVLAPNGRNRKQSQTINGSRVNPANGFPVRRISTISSIGPVEIGDSSLRVTRTFSKWEKQEREALSLAYLSELAKKPETAQSSKKEGDATVMATTTSLMGNIPASGQPSATAAPSSSSNFISFTKPAPTVDPIPAAAKASASNLPSLTIPSAPVQAPDAKAPMISFPTSSMGPQVTEQSKPVAPAAVPALPASSPFSFAKPAENKTTEMTLSTAPSAPATNMFSFPKPAETSTTATQQPSIAVPNFFAKPPAPIPSAAPTPGATNLFAVPPVQAPTQTSAPAAGQAVKTPFSFAFPGMPAQPPAPAPAPAKTETQSASGVAPSLLSRMGGFGAPAAPVAQAPSTSTFAPPIVPGPAAPNHFAAPSVVEKPAPVTFSFGPSSSFAPAPAPSSTSGPAPMKFSFTTGSTSAPTVTTPSAAPPPEASKQPVIFSFAPPTQSLSTVPAVSNTTQQPKFTFGTGSSQPVTFGVPTGAQQTSHMSGPPPTFNMPAAHNQSTTDNTVSMFSTPAKAAPSSNSLATGHTTGPAFAAPNVTSGSKFSFGPSAFTTPSKPTMNAASSNPFGASTTPAGTPGASAMFGIQTPLPAPSFGSTGSTFGASTTPAGKPPAPSIFGSNTAFGQGTTTPAGTPAQVKDAVKPIFSFGAPAGSTTPAGPPPGTQPKFSFGFNNPSMTSGADNGASSSGQPTPSAFGFGAPSTFSFGKPANPDAMQK